LNSFIINPKNNFSTAFEGFFFNENEFVSQSSSKDRFTFICLDTASNIRARFVLFIQDSEGLSPLRAPFGSFEFSEDFSGQGLEEFIYHIDNFAKEKKLSGLTITSWPGCYNPEKTEVLKKALLKNGFHILVEDHNYHLDVGDSFESFIHVSEKGKLNKSANAGFRFSIGGRNDIPGIHNLVAEARKQRGHPLSMSLADYENMFSQFPDRYILFTLHDHNKLIAACTGVKINSQILYNFLGADDVGYKSYSPMVMLMKGVYGYCVDNGYKIFDLGIGTANGIVNPGLVQFKKYLGGKFSYKFTYRKTYSYK
jgi:hypothetical protein